MQNLAGATEHIAILLLLKQSRCKGIHCGQEGECKCSFDKQPDENITAFTDRKGQHNKTLLHRMIVTACLSMDFKQIKKTPHDVSKISFQHLAKRKYLLKIISFKETLNRSFCKKRTWNCLSTNQQMPFLNLTGTFWHYCNDHKYFVAQGRINCFNQFLLSLMKYADNFLIYALHRHKICKFSILRQSWLSIYFPFDKNQHFAHTVIVLSQE